MALAKTKDTSPSRKKSAKKEKVSLLVSIPQYFRDVRVEFKKVIWPDRASIVSATIVVLVALAFFSIYTGVLDFIFSKSITLFLP